MTIIWMMLCAFFLWLAYLATKDLASPVIVSGVIWLAVYIMLFFTVDNRELSDIYYGSFFLAFVCFFFGFFVMKKNCPIHKEKIYYKIRWNPQFYNILLVIEYSLAIYWVIACWKNLFSQTRSIWIIFRQVSSENEFLSSSIMGIIQNMIPVMFFVSFGMYLCNPSKCNRNNTFLSLLPMIVTMLFLSRGGWFYILITCVFMIIFIRKPNNNTIIRIGIIGFIVIITIFVISSFDKYSNAWYEMSRNDKLNLFFSGYFINPPVAFVNWLNSNYELAYGKYTFRFFYALFRVIDSNIEVVDTVLPFIVTNGVKSNVYTSLQWYAHDYGILWAFVVEGVLGLFYGKIYSLVKKNKNPSLFSIILLSMFIFPIVNQFFDEKTFSILSIWIQRIFWLFLFTQTKLSVREYGIDEEHRMMMRRRFAVRIGRRRLL